MGEHKMIRVAIVEDEAYNHYNAEKYSWVDKM